MIHLKKLLAVGAAAAIAVSSTTAVAAPLGTGQFVLKDAAAGDVIHVGRSGRRNTAIGLGILGGVLLGGAQQPLEASAQDCRCGLRHAGGHSGDHGRLRARRLRRKRDG